MPPSGAKAIPVTASRWPLRMRGSAPAVSANPAIQPNHGAVLFKPYALATEAVTLLMFLAALAIAPDKEAA